MAHVEDDLADEISVREVLIPEVQVRCATVFEQTSAPFSEPLSVQLDIPMCPTCVKAVGDSSKSSSGRTACKI